MFDRIPAGTLALAAALLMTITPAPAHDESKYPDWSGMWRRPPGVGIQWDETKPPGLAQQAPLKPEFQKYLEESIAEQKAGGPPRRLVGLEQFGKWVFDQPFFVVLNLAVGGHFDGDPASDAIFPATMLVDYVRVFKWTP